MLAQTILLVLWEMLPETHEASVMKLIVFLGALLLMGFAAYCGVLPRRRPIVPGEAAVAD